MDGSEALARDNDTITTIVGAAVGALHGSGALRRDWRENLLGRTREDDDGRVFELINEARSAFFLERADGVEPSEGT